MLVEQARGFILIFQNHKLTILQQNEDDDYVRIHKQELSANKALNLFKFSLTLRAVYIHFSMYGIHVRREREELQFVERNVCTHSARLCAIFAHLSATKLFNFHIFPVCVVSANICDIAKAITVLARLRELSKN